MVDFNGEAMLRFIFGSKPKIGLDNSFYLQVSIISEIVKIV